MTYTVSFTVQFAREFQVFPVYQQTAITSFITTYQAHGLDNQTKFQGRVSPSWHNLPPNHPDYQYAYANDLWHYHLGLPEYNGSQQWGRVSDWLLHFQWKERGPHISLVDVYHHYRSDGTFYLPPATSLQEPSPGSTE